MTRGVGIAALIASVVTPVHSAPAQKPTGRKSIANVTTIHVPKEMKVKQAWLADLSGDGRADLIIAGNERGKSYGRFLRVHHDRGEGARTPFAQKPDVIVPLPPTVVACAVGDVHRDPGAEVIWFGSRGAYAWRPRAAETDRVVKLVGCEFLFQYPQENDVLVWQRGVLDIDGDGRVDLLLPEPDGYRIALQRRDPKRPQADVRFLVSTLSLPLRPPEKQSSSPSGIRGERSGDSFNLEISIDGGASAKRDPLVDVEEEVPAPQLQDWDGDRDLDVIVKHGDKVFVWLQAADGTFRSRPDEEIDFPLKEEKTKLDVSFGAWLRDFNDDRRADAVLFAKSPKTDETRTQVLFFPQKPESGTPLFHDGVPVQLLVLGGFTTRPRLFDVDGNGLPDLQVGAWRVDVLDQITAGEERSIDVELHVFLNTRGRFARRPSLTHKVTLDGDNLRRGGNRIFARFLGDVSGDGVSELLVRDRATRIQLFLVRKRGERLALLPRPIFQIQVAEEAEVRFLEDGVTPAGFLVLEQNQVLVVRF